MGGTTRRLERAFFYQRIWLVHSMCGPMTTTGIWKKSDFLYLEGI